MRAVLAAVAAATVFGGCARPGAEQQLVNEAANALGGQARIAAARTLVLEGEGVQYNLGQDLTPGASGQTLTVTDYRRDIELASGRMRVSLTRTPNFAYFRGRDPQRMTQGLDGPVGYDVGANGAAVRIADSAAADRRAEWNQHPLVAVRAALDPAAKLANARTEGGRSLVDVTAADGNTFTLAIDPATGLPASVSTLIYHPNLGDVLLITVFSGYEDVGGLNLPTALETRFDDFTMATIRISRQAIDGETVDLAAPAEAVSAEPPVPAVPVVTATPLAEGITYLKGGSHHSVLVEFEDHLMLIEAPQSEARTLAVIAKARELVPGKPLTRLLNTHHHFDHSAGVRAAMAEGLGIVTHAGNVAFFEEMARRPHTLQPDALSVSGASVSIEGVSDVTTISDGAMTVTLYPLSSSHSETMLIAYFPGQRMVSQADQYTPGNPVLMYAASFLAELNRLGLDVERIVPLHGDVAPYSQLVREAAGNTSPAG